jgi:hypothetical protein
MEKDMIQFPCKPTLYCDCDDTLIFWSPNDKEKLEKEGIAITCPTSLELDEDGILVQKGNWTQTVLPHKKHIEQLKTFKSRGHIVVVWSAGGADWASAAVKALKLEQYVDLCISKPTWVMDDLPVTEFMPASTWVEDKE